MQDSEYNLPLFYCMVVVNMLRNEVNMINGLCSTFYSLFSQIYTRLLFKYQFLDENGVPTGEPIPVDQEEFNRLVNEQLGTGDPADIPQEDILLDMENHFELTVLGIHLDDALKNEVALGIQAAYKQANTGTLLKRSLSVEI